jgi:large subunit ribosomal protein L16
MPLMPKRVKYRKTQRGKVRGNAWRGNTVSHGDFGLQATEGGWLSAEAIEAGRITATHSVRGEGRLYIRVFPHKSVTSIPAETRMGKGKGEPEFWAAVIKPRRPGARRLQDAVPLPFRVAASDGRLSRRLDDETR